MLEYPSITCAAQNETLQSLNNWVIFLKHFLQLSSACHDEWVGLFCKNTSLSGQIVIFLLLQPIQKYARYVSKPESLPQIISSWW